MNNKNNTIREKINKIRFEFENKKNRLLHKFIYGPSFENWEALQKHLFSDQKIFASHLNIKIKDSVETFHDCIIDITLSVLETMLTKIGSDGITELHIWFSNGSFLQITPSKEYDGIIDFGFFSRYFDLPPPYY